MLENMKAKARAFINHPVVRQTATVALEGLAFAVVATASMLVMNIGIGYGIEMARQERLEHARDEEPVEEITYIEEIG